MEEEEESSMNSSISKDVVSSNEDSGWTAYFEDSSDEHSDFSSTSCFGSSSMVSDASSYPALLKSCEEHEDVNNNIVPYSSIPKKLNLKKSRAKEIISDVDLEDSASSPVNSPKVSDLRQTDPLNPRKAADGHNMCTSLGKGGTGTSEQVSGLQEETRCERNNGYTNLKKKKGLRLVPMSFLVNHLG